ncbi:PAS domain S-box-containing protein [Roseateles toxinivorans]|uniref:Virulence sensor protein BvgS n=2 Tax=Roseateles toxinivorans TaxID=270368 RepID=A0A4R6QIL6_9BURK|nr:PAS domain S-box-containing protein [Roseateles toxinivorans]
MLWGIALAFGLVAVHQVAVESLERQRERIDVVQLGVGKVSRDAAGLLVLTQDYLLHGHVRARRQWHAVHTELIQTLHALDGPAVGLKDDIDDLVAVTEGLPSLFAALESAAGAGAADADAEGARRQMLSDHLVAETRRISDGAFDLVSGLIDLRSQQQHRLRSATLAANASLAALLAGLVAMVLRRVLRPMRRLQDTARCIEAGELQARSAYPAPDEFGSLSQSFDAMIQSLQDRQAALEATRRDLRTVLDAMPSMIGYWDRNLDNRVANRAYHTWFGVDADTLPGRNMRELLGPTLFESNRPYIEAALRGEPQTFERSIPRPDGQGLRHSLAHYLPDRQGDEVKGFYVIVHDVTELNEGRLQLAAALRENEALLAAIQQYAIFSEMGSDGRFITVNDNVCQLTGFSREELLGKTYAVHQPLLSSGDFDSEIWPALRAGRAWQGEIGGVAKDGSVYWTYAVMVPVKAEDGSIRKYVSIRTDITAQKRLAQEVQRSNERFELAAGAAGIGVWDYDVVAGTLVWDDQMYALYGRHRSGGLEPYTLWSDSVHPEDRASSEKALQDSIDGYAAFDRQFRIVRPDGEERYLKAMARVVRDANGRPLRMIGVNFDVTERLRTEAALQANENLLRSVGRMALVGGWRVDLRAGRVHWSEQTRAIHELPADFEPTLDTAMNFYAPESRPVITDAVNRAIASGRGWDLELCLITYTGRTVWVRAMGEVEFDAQDKPAQLVGALQDITERRRTDDLLRAATAAAEAASAAKSAFLANMSHEIRTPLNAVIGLAHLLQRTPLSTEQAPYVQNILLSGKALLGIVNDVLDLSKIEAGEMALERTTFSLRDVSSSLEALFEDQAHNKGLVLAMTPEATLPDALLGDPTRLRQVLVNLLGNAIKFTEHGQVELRIQALAAPAGHCRLRFEVRDTGVGIAADVLPTLFAPFSQADASTTRRFGGTGLGLSITKHLAELMGGQVGVLSTPGQGSCFWVELPFELGDATELASAAQVRIDGPRLQGVRVLLVDDSDINLQVAGRLLELEGALVQPARDGAEALRWVQQRADFDIVLMDVQMPIMDGLEATRRIRAMPERAGLPVVALTAGNTDTEHRRAREAGLQDILSKPIDPELLVQGVLRLLGRAPVVPAVTPTVNDLRDWPQIEGIDTNDSRRRLAGDVELMRRMLRRMLVMCEECLGVPATTPEQRQALAALMHKLRGSAATLGAKSMAALAGQVESACQPGQAGAVAPLLAQLGEEARQLQAAAAAWLQTPPDRPGAEAGAPPLDTQRMADLMRALRSKDLAAESMFEALAPALRGVLDAEVFRTLATCIEDLEFEQALALLRELS